MKPATLLLGLALGACAPVQLSGPIDHVMVMKVTTAAVVDGKRTFTISDSPGGSVTYAAFITGILDGTGSRLIINGPCYSACALVALTVKHREATPKAFIAIHHTTKNGVHDEVATQDAINWMMSAGVPQAVAEQARGAELHYITPREWVASGGSR